MSTTLIEAGLRLRTLSATDLDKLVSDLNYNLEQILKLPGFVGIKGAKGDVISGVSGERGSIWIKLIAQDFIAGYTNIVSGSQINISFLTTQYTADLAKLLTTLKIDKLVNGDVLILPNMSVVRFDSTNATFKDLGINFSTNNQLSEEDVRTIVSNMISSSTSGNPIYTIKNAYAKNVADSLGSGLNTISNPSSVLDVPISGSQIGKVLNTHKFIYADDTFTQTTDDLSFITGAPRSYHDLVQRTLEDKTVDYLPGVDDSSALTILQNNNKNGICLGNKSATSFEDFGRIFRDDNSLNLISNYGIDESTYGYLKMSKNNTELYNPLKLFMKSDLLEIEVKKLQHKLMVLDAQTNNITLGSGVSGTLELLSKNIKFLNSFTSKTSTFVGLSNNELINSPYNVNTSLTQKTTDLVPHALLYTVVSNINNTISDLEIEINENVALIQKGFIQRNYYDGNSIVNFNQLTQSGMYTIKKPIRDINYLNAPTPKINEYGNDVYGMGILNVYGTTDTVSNTFTFYQQYRIQSDLANTNYFEKCYVRYGIKNLTNNSTTFNNWLAVSADEKITPRGNLKYVHDNLGRITIEHNSVTQSDVVTNINDVTSSTVSLLTSVNVNNTGGHVVNTNKITVDTSLLKAMDTAQLSEDILPAGSIIMYNGTSVPNGYALCNGSTWDVANKTQVSASLVHYTSLRTNISNGKWVKTPDLSNKFIMGYGGSVSLKQYGGSNTVTLSSSNMPRHRHDASGLRTDVNTHNHALTLRREVWPDSDSDANRDNIDNHGDGARALRIYANNRTKSTANAQHSHLVKGSTAYSGSGSSFSVIPQYYAVMYIMKLPTKISSTKSKDISTEW